jgi:Xaa-Pro aminopeptidase
MTTYLLVDDALRSLELRHEVGEPVMDAVIFIEHHDRRIVVASSLEAPTFEAREDVVDEFWNIHELGSEDLMKDEGFPLDLMMAELAARALEKLGVTDVTVPGTFRLGVADHLRQRGLNLRVDEDVWAARRRRKTPSELEGMERAQRAVDTAMLTAARMLRDAEPTAKGALRYEGEILTAEWIREVMAAELLSQGAESEEIIVQSGDACLRAHDLGRGPILPDRSVIIDCFPRERRSGAYTDMTRTFVPGTPSSELQRLHDHCRAALDLAYNSIRPGASDVHDKVSDYFHEHGFPTRKHHRGSDDLTSGFFHSLGHGVGLEVHERPYVGRRPDALIEGDVIAIEPGLYFEGIGGVRLEDTVLVTASGPEHLTDPLPYDLTP